MAATPDFPVNVLTIRASILPANTTDLVDVYDNSAGTKHARIESLNITSDDTVTKNIQFYRTVGATSTLIGTVRVVTLSGTDGAAARVNALTYIGTLASDAINVLEVGPGGKLQAKVLVTVTAAKTVSISGWARTYE